MAYHFEVEQQVQGEITGFFGFNGTAGVWRIRALEDAGGWLARTTVEDMVRGGEFVCQESICKMQAEGEAVNTRVLVGTDGSPFKDHLVES